MKALLVLLAGCSLELGPGAEWIDASALDAVEITQPATLFAQRDRVRVVTFNVETGRDVEGLARVIGETPALASAELLLLQEIESHPGEGGSRAGRLAAALGMGYVYAPERVQGDGTHGTAILSRLPFDRVQVMQLAFADLAVSRAPRIAVGIDVHAGDAVLRVIDLHLDTRLNISDRIVQLRPVVLDALAPVVVGGDFNTNPYAWVGDSVPQVPAGSLVDTDQAGALDDYMRHIDYATPTAALGPTVDFGGVVDARLDSIYVRGLAAEPGEVVRTISISDHWPVYADIVLR